MIIQLVFHFFSFLLGLFLRFLFHRCSFVFEFQFTEFFVQFFAFFQFFFLVSGGDFRQFLSSFLGLFVVGVGERRGGGGDSGCGVNAGIDDTRRDVALVVGRWNGHAT